MVTPGRGRTSRRRHPRKPGEVTTLTTTPHRSRHVDPSHGHVETWNRKSVPERVAQRAYERHSVSAEGCWISSYSVGSHGYAQVGWTDRTTGKTNTVLAHRASWTHVHGQVPYGMTLDHICKQRLCVNPDHLRLMSNFENARRTSGLDWPIGVCKHGHPASEMRYRGNGQAKDGTQRFKAVCRLCNRQWQRDYRARKQIRKAA
ncbi:HNH endonuclease signature motif containing protein [Pseudoclavibacter albus]|uniref:HNH endonuclease signature motif containing protein n=1 Tax=Pseudoclavibacter albus TaxID=272241 RepID=UPI0035CCE125